MVFDWKRLKEAEEQRENTGKRHENAKP